MLRTTITLAALLALPVSAQSPLDALQSQTANAGLYTNRIPDRTFSRAFTEVCITGGGPQFDVNEAGESTQGGPCRPGQKGWVIERDQREAATWPDARIVCTVEDMRLPESFEWLYSCTNAGEFGLSNMIDDYEWAGNTVTPMTNALSETFSVAIPTYGQGSCSTANWFGFSNLGNAGTLTFRCVR